MRLIALLSWYDERPDWLAELVASMARAGVDHVVAVDGSYALYPRAQGSSGSMQAAVVTATALGARMGVTVHVPQGPWIGNEIEKRTFMFAAGHLIADPGEDWLWVCDGDEVITTAPGIREALERTPLDVGEVLLWDRDGSTGPIRKLFRTHPGGIRVEGHHARYLNGADEVLWNAGHPVGVVDAENVWDVRVQHRPAERSELRNEHRNRYYALRRTAGVEG